ncbi:putative protein ABIL1 [Acorus gramineus]|uniref:Uncharacterized protein n=1 Tax=Acorus gramineus TaxID=55184 RepID=A0AAV9AXK2_ACOGR|nr:putative protein ABIL1 [Acorus gramineus]
MEAEGPVMMMMTFDEVSIERSKSFVKALQELRNLRPQLYSAAEYCEKSHLHSEQKQMVLDNLKDYAVRALVNVVDHFGTVAYKLTDLLEQQTSDISALELKISCRNQQILFCQAYTDMEGLRQQKSLTITPRHQNHYILPSQQDSMEISKPLSAFRSFDIHGRREIQRSPIRSKSMLKGIFGKNKSAK